MLPFPGSAAPAALGATEICRGSLLKCQVHSFLRHSMNIFVQNMLKFKETEKALYAFVSDTETWVECGKMRKT